MNVWLSLEATSAAAWTDLLQKVRFYQEETLLRVDDAAVKTPTGIKLKCAEAEAHRLFEIFAKAGLIGPLRLIIDRIPPQNDPEEKEILSKLYRGGDTSQKPEDTIPREVKTERPDFYLSKKERAEELKEEGRRAAQVQE